MFICSLSLSVSIQVYDAYVNVLSIVVFSFNLRISEFFYCRVTSRFAVSTAVFITELMTNVHLH